MNLKANKFIASHATITIVVLGVYNYINIPYRIQILSGVRICLHIHLYN